MNEELQTISRVKIDLVPLACSIPPGLHAVTPRLSQRNQEFTRLLHAVNAMNRQDQRFILQFLASMPREGTSTVAAGFARAAASQRAKPILIVDCGLMSETHPRTRPPVPSLIDAFHQSGAIEVALQAVAGLPEVKLARLTAARDAPINIDPGDLHRLFNHAKQTFHIIVLDCPPPTHSPDSLALASCCDGTILVVRANVTPRAVVAETKQAIERFGGQILGVVFNQARAYIPPWLQSWC